MSGVMNENVIVEEYDFDKPLIQKTDSLIVNCIRNCHDKYFHTFDHICEYLLNFTNITNNETVNFTISDKTMGLFELNVKLTVAGQNGFKYNQINKLTITIYSNLSNINIRYYLKLRIPICHCQFFRNNSQKRDYIQTHCNDRRNPFHFACRHCICIIIHNVDIVYLHLFKYEYLV